MKEKRNQVSRHLLEPDEGDGRETNLLDLNRSWCRWRVMGPHTAVGGNGIQPRWPRESWCQRKQTPGDTPAPRNPPLEVVFTPSPGNTGPAVGFFQLSTPQGSWDEFHGWRTLLVLIIDQERAVGQKGFVQRRAACGLPGRTASSGEKKLSGA